MKIYQNDDSLVHCAIDFKHFKKEHQISRQYFTESFWSDGEAGTSILNYNIFFSLKNQNTNDYFIRYERRLVLRCLIEDINKDTYDIIKIKEAMNNSIAIFLEQTPLSSYGEFDFTPMPFSEMERLREKTSIERLKGINS
ncbi:hypothetical protein FHW88_001444 [Mucilaginibacter sp. SG538B]|uniref:hypothetical protein n=1 Tax=Mucilaginibacter sp. SG538B TaxID=2587021 RepID=UPI00159DDE2D|nr:hypothetical protein [Mucilaginibacter sp. SG538B]NVM63168.1 hypothetical protein [Mucilaginibacter sp. SG538B]